MDVVVSLRLGLVFLAAGALASAADADANAVLAVNAASSDATASEAGGSASSSTAETDVGDAASTAEANSAGSSQDRREPDRRESRADQKPRSTVGEQNTALDEIREAIQVFKQESERYGARGDESSRRKSVSQSSSWHGRVYEYIRNNAFDAVPHEVVQNGGDQNILRRNQFGFSVSGPVVVPKLYNGRRSTFFTFSYEGTREKVGRSYLNTLPTAQQRGGDFSDLVNSAGAPVTVYDPRSTRANPLYDPSQAVSTSNLEFDREAFPNNQVPLSRLDPTAAAIGRHYPLPNTDIGPFLRNNYWSNPLERNNPDGFISRVDHNLFYRHKLTFDLALSNGFAGQPRIYDTLANPGYPDRDFLDRRLGLRETYAVSPNTVYEASIEATTDVIATEGVGSQRNVPQELGLQGVSGTVFPTLRFADYYGMGAPNGAYRRNARNTYELENSLSIRRGKHNWTLSAEITRYQLNTLELDSPSGELSFNEGLTGLPGINNTGDAYASFLLGEAYRGEVTDQPQPMYLRRTAIDTNIGDEIELTPNLTLSLRLSIDVETPRVEKYDRQSTVDLEAINPVNGLPGALVFAGRGGRGRGFQPVRVRPEPRVGLSWSPTAKRNTVVRASFMHYYTDIGLRSGLFGGQGFNGRRTAISPNQQLEPALTLRDGFAPAAFPLPDLRPEAANDTRAALIPDTASQPRLNYLSLSFERRLPAGLIFRAGSRSYRGKNMLVGSHIAGYNRIPLAALGYRDRLNDESFRRTLRPYPHYQSFRGDYQIPLGKYLYDSGDFTLEKRASQGLTFDLGYRYMRRMDDYTGPGIQNPFDRETAWAITRGNRPHRLSLSYMYELPLGDGKSLLQSGVLSKVFGGWSVSGFTSWLSGDPVSLEPEFNNTGTVVPYLRVNAVEGVDPHLDNPTPGAWFNPLAFSHPDDFALGDVARTHPTLSNPSWQNHDLAVTKRVALSAEKSLELLFQGFNFVNGANWNDPDAEIGPDNARNVNAGRIIGSRGGRVLQLGMRYNF